jgi:hypothetical protein
MGRQIEILILQAQGGIIAALTPLDRIYTRTDKDGRRSTFSLGRMPVPRCW